MCGTARDQDEPPPLGCARLCCAPASRLPAAAISSRFQTASPRPQPAQAGAHGAQTPAAEREHERILSSYGGAYDDPKLEALIGKTVDRLVAASERPDLAYKVTILNSGAVNAFALPTGQLYVTRGLIALASDTSELSSVLCARDGACAGQARVDPRGPGAAGRHRHPRRHRHGQRSGSDGAGAGQVQTDDGELFARPGIRGRRHRRRHFGARPFRSLWRGAFPDRDGAQCRAEGRQDLARSARAGFSVVASGDAGAGAERAGQCAAILPRRKAASATARPTSPRSTTSSMAKIRAKASCAAGASCIRSSASPFRRRKPSRSTIPRRR